MDDRFVGRQLRAMRQRRGFLQDDLAARAGVSQSTISRLECGSIDGATVRTLRAVSRALRMPPVVSVGWRGSEVARLFDVRHAAVVEGVVRELVGHRWRSLPEWSFSRLGAQGVADVLALREDRLAALIIEAKSEIVDVQATLGPMDRKRRLIAGLIEAEFGWRPESLGIVLALPEGSRHRHVIDAHRATFDAALPIGRSPSAAG